MSTIEVVRGRLDRARTSELLSFWAAQGALAGQAAQRRLPEMVCLLRQEGKLVGATSAYAANVELLGGRPFWIYRSLLDQAAASQAPALIRATFSALQAAFNGEPGAPIGLCVLIADREGRRRHPQAEWSHPRSLYAGYLPDGRQLRVAYFKDAQIAPPLTVPTTAPATAPGSGSLLPSGYHIEPFAEQERISVGDVLDLWAHEDALPPDEAERRVPEILLVASDEQHRPVGISTSYLHRNDQLRAELWYTRVFVAAAHRRSGLAIAIAHAARDHLIERYRSGVDRRGIGILFEVESEILKRYLPQAIWPRTEFAFIGEDERGNHIRVYYFPGAPAPEPD